MQITFSHKMLASTWRYENGFVVAIETMQKITKRCLMKKSLFRSHETYLLLSMLSSSWMCALRNYFNDFFVVTCLSRWMRLNFSHRRQIAFQNKYAIRCLVIPKPLAVQCAHIFKHISARAPVCTDFITIFIQIVTMWRSSIQDENRKIIFAYCEKWHSQSSSSKCTTMLNA